MINTNVAYFIKKGGWRGVCTIRLWNMKFSKLLQHTAILYHAYNQTTLLDQWDLLVKSLRFLVTIFIYDNANFLWKFQKKTYDIYFTDQYS